jgi:hypothetical protein
MLTLGLTRGRLGDEDFGPCTDNRWRIVGQLAHTPATIEWSVGGIMLDRIWRNPTVGVSSSAYV